MGTLGGVQKCTRTYLCSQRPCPVMIIILCIGIGTCTSVIPCFYSALLHVLIPFHRDRFRTTVNVLGDCYGVGIVQRYSRKQLGPPPPPVVSQSPKTTPTISTVEERAHSPIYGSSNGAPCVSPTGSLMNDGSTSVLESGIDALLVSTSHKNKTVED